MGRDCRPSLETVIAILKTEMGTYTHVFIVLDALDECFPEQIQVDLLENILSLATTPNVKVMVTSRSIPSIESAIRPDVTLEITAMERDIKSYVEARIHSNSTLKRLIMKAPPMEEKVVQAVVENAQGMCVVVDFCHCCSDKSFSQVSPCPTAHGQPCQQIQPQCNSQGLREIIQRL